MGNSEEENANRKVEKKLEDNNEDKKKLKYPKQVFFIIGNEFCERFSYYGMKAILVLYFKSKLGFDEDLASVVYHAFSFFCYFTPILGALIADQYLGKFRTIVYISILYILGHLLKTLAAITPLGVPPVEFSMVGLLLIALGTGGIKPCVAAFGGDQFQLPEQERPLQTFFSVFYFAINIGALAATIITPILRYNHPDSIKGVKLYFLICQIKVAQDVSCFDSKDHTCYALAFGVPAILMLVATIIVVLGKPMYKMKPPQGNVLTQVVGSIFFSLRKIKSRNGKDHWLDVAKEKYDAVLVEDTKVLLRIFLLYIPLPIFWALFDQQGSRWTFQATRMNGQLGSTNIKPDQMQMINAALILILIPVFDWIVYPILFKLRVLKRPLERIVAGGVFAAIAFFLSGIVELQLEKTYDRIPVEGTGHIHLMNSLSCNMSGSLNSTNYSQSFNVSANKNVIFYDLPPGLFNMALESQCELYQNEKQLNFELDNHQVQGIIVLPVSGGWKLKETQVLEDPKKSDSSFPKIRAIFGYETASNQTMILHRSDHGNDTTFIESVQIHESIAETDYTIIESGKYSIFLNSNGSTREIGNSEFLQGAVYTLVISQDPDSQVTSFKLTQENSIHMLWLFPQYFALTVGEILFSVTGLEFSYSQAPASMKSVVQAAWLLTVAFGNLIVILVAEAKSDALSKAGEFFLFGALMIDDMILFAGLAIWFVRAEEKRLQRGIDNPAAEDISLEDRSSNQNN